MNESKLSGDRLHERVAVLESRVDDSLAIQSRILLELKGIHGELTKYKGFVGGILFVLSGAITLLLLLKGWLFGK